MSSADWQDYTNWQGAPFFAGNVAVTGVFQDLAAVAALGSYQAMLCYVAPGGASAVQLTFVFSMADTGAGVVTWSRSVYCPPGVSSLFTVPAFTNQVRIRARSNVNVSADIAIWPTNAYPRYGVTADHGSLWQQFNVNLGAGATQNVDLPVYAGAAKLTIVSGGGLNVILEPLNVAGGQIGYYLNAPAIVANYTADVVLGLGWNRLVIGNPTAGVITVNGTLMPSPGI